MKTCGQPAAKEGERRCVPAPYDAGKHATTRRPVFPERFCHDHGHPPAMLSLLLIVTPKKACCSGITRPVRPRHLPSSQESAAALPNGCRSRGGSVSRVPADWKRAGAELNWPPPKNTKPRLAWPLRSSSFRCKSLRRHLNHLLQVLRGGRGSGTRLHGSGIMVVVSAPRQGNEQDGDDPERRPGRRPLSCL